MKIKYIWHDQPRVEKVYDTEKAYSHLPMIFKKDTTQERFDQIELRNMACKKERGCVLSYEVIEGS